MKTSTVDSRTTPVGVDSRLNSSWKSSIIFCGMMDDSKKKTKH
jgi:hypothetical protein